MAVPVLLALPQAATAQQNSEETTVSQALETAQGAYGPPPPVADCSDEQQAAEISGEIIVCRRLLGQEEFRIASEDEAETRYAEETMDQGNPRAPAMAPPPCDPQTVGCFRIGSVPPPAYIIDFSELPETPPGSDADRVGQGLASRGNDEAVVEEQVSPAGSAAPVAER